MAGECRFGQGVEMDVEADEGRRCIGIGGQMVDVERIDGKSCEESLICRHFHA